MTQRLTVTRLTSIGAVEAGDNPEADILFWKRKPHEPEQGQTKKAGTSVSDIDLTALDDATREYVEGLQAKLADAEPTSPLPDDLDPVVTKRLDDLEADVAKEREEKQMLADQVAKLREEQATEKYMKKAVEYAPFLGDPETTMPALKAVGTATPEAWEILEPAFDAVIEKQAFAELLKEYGSSAAEGSAMDAHAAAVDELRKNDPELSLAEARAEAWRRNPELKTQAREEGVL